MIGEGIYLVMQHHHSTMREEEDRLLWCMIIIMIIWYSQREILFYCPFHGEIGEEEEGEKTRFQDL